MFIYLNDLEEDAEGETYFPELDIKFIPRKGCAVMWPNLLDANGGDACLQACSSHACSLVRENEDPQVMHAGLPPLQGVKYGVNCFFNVKTQEADGDVIPCYSAR